jgi:hypothetical protein
MKVLYKLCKYLSHASVILALCFLTFTVLDWYNPLMAFTTNALSTKLLIAFCIVTILSSVGNLILARSQTDILPRQSSTQNQ